PVSKCLKYKHEATTVEHLEELAELDDLQHETITNCDCENCGEDRAIGCQAPYHCAEGAGDLLAVLAPKWNLNTALHAEDEYDALPTTPPENTERRLDEGDALVFQPHTDSPSEVAHLYRIFARHLSINRDTPLNEIMQRDAAVPTERAEGARTTIAYACGSTIHGRTDNAKGGYALHFPNGEAPDSQGACAGKTQSQERSAVTAIIRAATEADPAAPLLIITNSKSAVKKLTLLAKKNEKRGWIDHPENTDVLRQAMATLRKRAGRTELACVTKKHARPETAVMEQTTRRAREAARHERPIEIHTREIEHFDAPGATLQGITQKIAHNAIRQIRAQSTPARRKTKENVDKTKAAVQRQNKERPTEDQIWLALKSRDLSRNVRNFLWKALHSGHKIGDYFTGMPAPWNEYAQCALCNRTETLQHILFDCSSNETRTVWALAKTFMEHKLDVWPDLDVGAILGAPLLKFSDTPTGMPDGTTRAARIVISESAFLIWKIRCERCIEHEGDPDKAPSAEEITGRWYQAINARIANDRYLTNKRRYKNKALDKDLVLDTWERLLELPENVPEDWIRHPGVLVGRGTTRPRGRER
ncbi:hypothetical protein EXIGLDRAFT_809315, partial [Exidia glandulosa HHB12029]